MTRSRRLERCRRRRRHAELSSNIRVFAGTTPTDMRKQFDGLYALVTGIFGHDVFDGHLFLFFNRRRDRLKARRTSRRSSSTAEIPQPSPS